MILLLIPGATVYAQGDDEYTPIDLYGHVVYADDGRPVAGARLVLNRSHLIFRSNEQGRYLLLMRSDVPYDSLWVQAPGTKLKRLLVKNLLEGDSLIRLEYDPIPIAPVEVAGQPRGKRREVKLGNWKTSWRHGFENCTYSGYEVSMRVRDTAGHWGHLKRVRFALKRNDMLAADIRIRIYTYDTALRQPGVDLLRRSVMVKAADVRRHLEVDLSDEGIVIPPEGVCVSLEFLYQYAEWFGSVSPCVEFIATPGQEVCTWERRNPRTPWKRAGHFPPDLGACNAVMGAVMEYWE